MSEANEDLVKKIIEDICFDFFVPVPQIIYVDDFQESKTLRMAISNDGKTLLIKKNLEKDADFLFDLAHELRHLYQIHEGLMDNYIPRSQLSLEDYNKQFQEIDAHAFAAIFMEVQFGIKPLFTCFNQETKNLIEDRKKEILETEF